MPHHFRKTPSSRREARLTASWLVTGLTIATEIKYGRRTTHLLPCKPSHHHRRFHEAHRLSVRAYVGGPTECHITITSALGGPYRPEATPGTRVQLRDIDYPTVRELGYVRVDDFQDAWVREHDPAWMRKLEDRDITGEAEEMSWAPEAWLAALNLGRFDRHWAHRDVWLLRFALDTTRAPRLLAERSDELYVDTAARALREEMPALYWDEWELHIARPARDREHERQAMLHADRAAQSAQERLRRARDAASVKGLDMRSEFRRYERLMLHERMGDAVRQLELIESRVFPARAAA